MGVAAFLSPSTLAGHAHTVRSPFGWRDAPGCPTNNRTNFRAYGAEWVANSAQGACQRLSVDKIQIVTIILVIWRRNSHTEPEADDDAGGIVVAA